MQAFLKNSKTAVATASASEKEKPTVTERRKPPAPWVEKYRPRSVEDVVEQAEVVAVLRKCVEGADLPNMLLYGPPGTGKTSTILAAARQIFGDMYCDRILELNASDERGINVVRTKIKNFAQLTASGVRPDGRPCPPFKIIVLDEADSMTHAAQAALRRTMEKESRSTRFCLVCNYVSRIIVPITSRCTKFRFKPLGEEKIIARLQHICELEGVKIEPDAYKSIVQISGGDMRRAITTLQSCYRLKGAEHCVSSADLLEMSGIIPESYLHDYLEVCRSGKYEKLEEFVAEIGYSAYSVGQMMEQLVEFIVRAETLTDKEKAIICDKLGECAFRLQDGGSEYLQIMDLGCQIMLALK
ncbi:replication factor C subunit 4 [Scaptodrosophila lebanonensis]|uniref:Replication factor C subunit 2 n=1 Tax=Drosophila lebanonensis TaxID=7225 RepID=A0A6J2TDE1_DROLE|nr:replication factor C subunit 4 [Scaptodrosophila lebanonensis]